MIQSYFADKFHQSSDVKTRQHLCSASLSSLVFHRTQLSTTGERAFLVTAFQAVKNSVSACHGEDRHQFSGKNCKTHLFSCSSSQ